MAATYDLTTDVGKCRLRIPDTQVANAMFSDEELQVFLNDHADEDNADLLAAADALEIIAGDPARVEQYSRGQQSTRRAAAADIWRKIDRYRVQARGGIQVGTIERSDFW